MHRFIRLPATVVSLSASNAAHARAHKSQRHVGVANKLRTVAADMCWSAGWNWLCVALLTYRILRWLLDFGISAHPNISHWETQTYQTRHKNGKACDCLSALLHASEM